MRFTTIEAEACTISEVLGDANVVAEPADITDVMANAGSDRLIMRMEQFTPEFFSLSTGKLGEALQKLTNYRVRLAIVGDFSPYMTTSFRDFVYESNRAGDFLFVPTRDEAIAALSR
jgi:hypothetical protein